MIIPAEESDIDARKTIVLLCLNCRRLRDRRKSLISILDDASEEYLRQSLINCVDFHSGFYTVIEYMMRQRS